MKSKICFMLLVLFVFSGFVFAQDSDLKKKLKEIEKMKDEITEQLKKLEGNAGTDEKLKELKEKVQKAKQKLEEVKKELKEFMQAQKDVQKLLDAYCKALNSFQIDQIMKCFYAPDKLMKKETNDYFDDLCEDKDIFHKDFKLTKLSIKGDKAEAKYSFAEKETDDDSWTKRTETHSCD